MMEYCALLAWGSWDACRRLLHPVLAAPCLGQNNLGQNKMIRNSIRPFTGARIFVGCISFGRVTSSAILLALTIVLVGCAGGTGNGGGGNTPPPTASLTVSPATIIAGQNITLTWASTNADQGTIDNGVGIVGLNGSTSQGLFPTTTTTYTYTATGPSGTKTASATVTVNVVTSFVGLKQSDGAANEDVDPNGAVGTKQFMEYVNTSFQAYDKVTGKAVWSSAQQLETLWPTGPCAANQTTGKPTIQLDAVIIFDRLASRWVVGAKTTNPNASVGYHFCLAVSNTDDLSSSLRTWTDYTSAGPLDPILGVNTKNHTYFPDWPKLATWTDSTGTQSAYYATMDLQDTDNGNAESGSVVCAFDRTDILNNPANVKPPSCVNISDTSNTLLWSTANSLFLAHSLIPADVDGTALPPAGRDEFMVSIANPADGLTTSTTMNLWDFHLDWTAATPLTVSSQSPISLAVDSYTPGCYLYDPNNPAITNCVYEPPAAAGQPQEIVDSVGDRLMPRFAYRNFGSYESYLVSHTIQTGPGAGQNSPNPYQTGVRWYELRDSGSGTPAIQQSGTINPDGVLYRFLPSIAQDKLGNAAVGYSISNVFTDPGIYFSYWNLPQATTPAEISILNGTGEEVTTVAPYVGKWGSYASMTVDPVDDCTFWYVNQYFAQDDTWLTRVANFKIPGCQ
jgi:hypothetical protein